MDRVNASVREFFNALAQVRRSGEGIAPMPEVLHGRLRSFLERAMRQATDAGFSPQDARDIGYVLAALADEVVLSKGGELRDFWLARTLQLQFFNENTAGEGVFDRLRSLLVDPTRAEVLRVYYLALLFGFQGKYRIRGGEIELATIIDEVSNALARAGQLRETDLSPHGARPKESNGRVRRNMPLVAMALVAAGLSVVLYVGLQFSLDGETEALLEKMDRTEAVLGE